jgi:hypothetical protein
MFFFNIMGCLQEEQYLNLRGKVKEEVWQREVGKTFFLLLISCGILGRCFNLICSFVSERQTGI